MTKHFFKKNNLGFTPLESLTLLKKLGNFLFKYRCEFKLFQKFNHKRNKFINPNFLTGFTVIEVTVVIFIFSLVGLAYLAFQSDVFNLSRVLRDVSNAQQDARQALKIWAQEIRSASPSSLGAYPLAEAESDTLTFYSDTDKDGLKEKIRYFLDGDKLKKGTIVPSGDPLTYNPANEQVKVLVSDVANEGTALFEYYDTDYDGTSAPLPEPVNILSVRLIKTNLLIDRDPSRPPPALTVSTQVTIRNLKDNL